MSARSTRTGRPSFPSGSPRRSAVDPSEVLPRAQARKLDRSAQLALIAAREAWADAGFTARAGEDTSVDPDRLGAVIASGIGGVTTLLGQYDVLKEKGVRRVSPHTVPMLMPNGPSANVGLDVNARAGVHTPVCACASGSEAIGYAIEMIRYGPRRRRRRGRHGGGHPPAADRRLRQHDGDVEEQRRPAGRLPPLRRRPQRLRPGRGRRRDRPGVRRARRQARRPGLRRGRRSGHLRRQPRHRAARAVRQRHRARAPEPPGLQRPRPGGDRARERARHLDAGRRPGRAEGAAQGRSATTPTTWRSPPRSR